MWDLEGHMVNFISGASRVRSLPPEQFCRHGFVMGKSSEAGFGNEMYKVLTGAALSIMLNRSLIIGQTRHIGLSSSLSVLYHYVVFIILPITTWIFWKADAMVYAFIIALYSIWLHGQVNFECVNQFTGIV